MVISRKKVVGCGAGPKNLAIATLLASLSRDGDETSIDFSIVEPRAVGANWSGESGLTDGRFLLDTSPLKDLGFPYKSGYGAEVDRRLADFSFVEYLKQQGRYPDWVNRGGPKVSHAELAGYLGWAASRTGVVVEPARIVGIAPWRDAVELTLEGPKGVLRTEVAAGVVVTGPGEPRRASIQDADPDRIFDGRTYWRNRDKFRGLSGRRAVVFGGGQSAGTATWSLVQENPDLEIDVFTTSGFLAAQSGGFFENSLCTDPGPGWAEIPVAERREILRRIDQGVLEVSLKQALDAHPRVRVRRGRVRSVRSIDGRVIATLDGHPEPLEYDRAVVALGFDLVEQLRGLLPESYRPETWYERLKSEPRVERHLRPEGIGANIHVPGLAGLSQGPGFPLMSCLGLTAGRIISAYF